MATLDKSNHFLHSVSTRTLEKVLEEGQSSLILNLSRQKLREYPKITNYDLTDTIELDISRNRITDFPKEVCDYVSLERVDFSSNSLKTIALNIVNLKALSVLNLSCNQLSYLPLPLCNLNLKVLNLCNNKLVSLPDDISSLRSLVELDVSCNEITYLPPHIGNLQNLRILNLRKNLLVQIPSEISNLSLVKLDISYNKITRIPPDIRYMHSTLLHFNVQFNPLESPPIKYCSQGMAQIKKLLDVEAGRRKTKLPSFDNTANFQNFNNHFNNLLANSSPPNSGNSNNDLNCFNGFTVTNNNLNEVASSPKISPVSCNTGLGFLTSCLWKTPSAHNNAQICSNVDTIYSETCENNTGENNANKGGGGRPQTDSGYGTDVASLNEMIFPASNCEIFQNQSEVNIRSKIEKDNNNYESNDLAKRISGDSKKKEDSIKDHDSKPLKPIRQTLPLNSTLLAKESNALSFKNDDVDNNANGSVVIQDEFTRELNRQKVQYQLQKRKAEKLRNELFSPNGQTIYNPIEHNNHVTMNGQRESNEYQKSCTDDNPKFCATLLTNGHTTSERVTSEDTLNVDRDDFQYISNNTSNSVNNTLLITNNFVPSNNTYLKDNVDNKLIEIRKDIKSVVPEVNLRKRNSDKNINYNATANNTVAPLARIESFIENSDHVTEAYNINKDTINHILASPFKDIRLLNVKRYNNVNQNTPSSSYSDIISNSLHNKIDLTSTPKSINPHSVTSKINHSPTPLSYKQSKLEREIELIREDRKIIAKLREIIETRLKVVMPEDLTGSLMDGVALCHLVNNIKPHTISSIHVPSKLMPKLTMAKCKRNVDNFILACKQLGIHENDMCRWEDVVLDPKPRLLLKNLIALLNNSSTRLVLFVFDRDHLINLFCAVSLSFTIFYLYYISHR
ncbi:leucine-rich repeat and calponin homology domain-containing protein 1-like isoform X2 [Gordionus sp. m RMFG-2023]|uniref:leucine-rich repeat and calponin homology domain-containing protein 1-like isoform X2 n=1 Tax=Gordionus sp. m RMFG-2023 TaxID=3053472 RepID=UPI0031FC1123